jgi:GMP synthase (glutamine-hydrolysing)
LRRGQYRDLMADFRKKFSLNVIGVDASEIFLKRLKRVTSPERKRKIIGAVFIEIFERESEKLGGIEFLAQGTIYPDVIESNPVKGPSSHIKSHHNVGGLPKGLKFKLVEPLRELFKDEVRVLGKELGVDPDFIRQHPFPGPGLAVRVVGEVTEERLGIVREADAILLEEIKKERLYNRLWQAFDIGLLSRISNRIVNEIDGINRVLYDITSKPPGTIEWE